MEIRLEINNTVFSNALLLEMRARPQILEAATLRGPRLGGIVIKMKAAVSSRLQLLTLI